ncbi:hypothetical protein ACTFIU_002438 [Dictyostelium citrinum]
MGIWIATTSSHVDLDSLANFINQLPFYPLYPTTTQTLPALSLQQHATRSTLTYSTTLTIKKQTKDLSNINKDENIPPNIPLLTFRKLVLAYNNFRCKNNNNNSSSLGGVHVVILTRSVVYLLCSNQLLIKYDQDVKYEKALKDYNSSTYRYFIATIVTSASSTNYDSKVIFFKLYQFCNSVNMRTFRINFCCLSFFTVVPPLLSPFSQKPSTEDEIKPDQSTKSKYPSLPTETNNNSNNNEDDEHERKVATTTTTTTATTTANSNNLALSNELSSSSKVSKSNNIEPPYYLNLAIGADGY